ncbi:MAG: hypothetical protein E7044_12150 [Lentisphaerae bacterium]|nr:hypothetical protein [Lentisphaerota bacterium]
MFKYLSVIPVLLLFVCGCLSPRNNYLEARDFADLLKRDGLPVESIRVIPADPFRASSAVAIKVGDSEIGVYKYDITSDFQRKRLEKIEKSKRIHIAGIPYPVKVYGSFMFFGLEKNKHKRAILETIKSFK